MVQQFRLALGWFGSVFITLLLYPSMNMSSNDSVISSFHNGILLNIWICISFLFAQEILDGVTDVDLVVNLRIREDVLLEKCLGRRICGQCGKNFNVASINIKGENGSPGISMAPLLPPAHCMSKLVTRADDTEDVVKERLRIYYDMSQPVEEFYRSQGKLLEFELPGGIPESWPKLLQALNFDDYESRQSAAA